MFMLTNVLNLPKIVNLIVNDKYFIFTVRDPRKGSLFYILGWQMKKQKYSFYVNYVMPC